MPITTVEELRQDLPMTQAVAYFQTGTYGATSNTVLGTVSEAMMTEAHHGPATPLGRASHVEREIDARARLARLLNIPDDELAITTNTSRSMQLVIHSIDWQPGDEFIMTSSEHVSTYGISHELQNEYGVTVKVIPADQGDDVLLESLSGALTERTKLFCISHISSPDGCLLPVRETADVSHEWGVPVVLDVAQTVGQIPVDLAALDCDYVVGSGHKWLLGPMGTGFVTVSKKRLSGYRPNFIPDRSPWALAGTSTPDATARSRSEIGTYNHALVVGLGKAAEIADSIGLDTIQSTAAGLTKTLRDGVATMDRARIITSLEEGKYAGITSLMFDGFTKTEMDALVGRLYEEQKVVVKAQWLTAPPDPVKVAMRISVAAYNTQDEVDRLLTGLEEGLKEI
ncbi:MAG: aminotransferase class V-fold PLP-dependent enzyme [Chloroflexota bacterium]